MLAGYRRRSLLPAPCDAYLIHNAGHEHNIPNLDQEIGGRERRVEGREKYRLLNLATNNGCQASERTMRQRESARVPASQRCRLCFATAADATSVDRDPIDCRMRRGRGGQTSNSGREGTAFICYQVCGRSESSDSVGVPYNPVGAPAYIFILAIGEEGKGVDGTCAIASSGVAELVMKTKERRKERKRERGKREAELEEIEPMVARRECHLHHHQASFHLE